MKSLVARQKSFAARRNGFVEGVDTPRAFLEECIARIEDAEPIVKAFVHLDLEGARKAADASTLRYREGRPLSPIDGCPIGIKDIIETEGMPTGYGSNAFAGRKTTRDAACIQALRKAGAVLVGKTVTTEFAIGYSGPTVNPNDPARTPGGSSSGSAAAVAAGMVPVALGTQTNGSVLRPASYNGVLGYKGTFGSLPLAGVHPVAASLDHLGILAADIDDVWATTSAIIGKVGSPGYIPLSGLGERAPSAKMPRRLVRLHLGAWEEVSSEHRDIFEAGVDRLRAAGIDVIDHDNPAVAELEAALDASIGTAENILRYDMRWPFADYVAKHGKNIGERIRSVIASSDAISANDYAGYMQLRAEARALTEKTLQAVDGDAFVMPASSGPAPEGHAHTGSRAYLVYWSWLGFPAISLPLLEAEGLPWGLQLAHLAGRDDELIALSAALLPSKGLRTS